MNVARRETQGWGRGPRGGVPARGGGAVGGTEASLSSPRPRPRGPLRGAPIWNLETWLGTETAPVLAPGAAVSIPFALWVRFALGASPEPTGRTQ